MRRTPRHTGLQKMVVAMAEIVAVTAIVSVRVHVVTAHGLVGVKSSAGARRNVLLTSSHV
jgi:hypothetical protein